MRGTSIILGFCAAMGTAFAQAPDVDWKFYGGALVGEGGEYCFYDANGVAVSSTGYTRVWTKCLARKNVESVDIKKEFDGKILKATAEKVARYYVPPIARVENIGIDQAMTITTFEQTANISYIKPRSRIFYELNCAERMLRELSIYVEANGKTGSVEKPGDWKEACPARREWRFITENSMFAASIQEPATSVDTGTFARFGNNTNERLSTGCP